MTRRTANALALGLTALLAGVLFADLTEAVLRGGAVVRADNRISRRALADDRPFWRHLALGISHLGTPEFVVAALAVALVGLVVRRDWWRAGGLAIGFPLALVLGQAMRHAIGRSGPTGGSRLHVGGLGYPSGHALGAALAMAGLAMVVRRTWASVVAALIAVAVAVARVYVFAHFPSDVVASLLAGGAVTALVEALGGAGGPQRSDPQTTERTQCLTAGQSLAQEP